CSFTRGCKGTSSPAPRWARSRSSLSGHSGSEATEAVNHRQTHKKNQKGWEDMAKRRSVLFLCAALAILVALSATAFAGAPPGTEVVDGKLRFTTPRRITVEVFDRSNPGGSKP